MVTAESHILENASRGFYKRECQENVFPLRRRGAEILVIQPISPTVIVRCALVQRSRARINPQVLLPLLQHHLRRIFHFRHDQKPLRRLR
jgi:hypothetical protein